MGYSIYRAELGDDFHTYNSSYKPKAKIHYLRTKNLPLCGNHNAKAYTEVDKEITCASCAKAKKTLDRKLSLGHLLKTRHTIR